MFLALALAAGFSIADLNTAGKVASDVFVQDHQAHTEHFTGYKVWKSGADAKVKVYVDHGGMAMEYDYTCFKSASAIDCQED